MSEEPTPIKFVGYNFHKPRWDSNPNKTTTNNHAWRVGVFYIFEDYKGNRFELMPKYSFLDALKKGLSEVEEINKNLCKQHNQKNLRRQDENK